MSHARMSFSSLVSSQQLKNNQSVMVRICTLPARSRYGLLFYAAEEWGQDTHGRALQCLTSEMPSYCSIYTDNMPEVPWAPKHAIGKACAHKKLT